MANIPLQNRQQMQSFGAFRAQAQAQLKMQKSPLEVTQSQNIYGAAATEALQNVGRECNHVEMKAPSEPVDTFQPQGMDGYMKMLNRGMTSQQNMNTFHNLKSNYAAGRTPMTADQLAKDLKTISGLNTWYCQGLHQ